MDTLELNSLGISLRVDPETGRWLSLTGGKTNRNWLAEDADTGLPFVGGSGIHPQGNTVKVPTKQEGNHLKGKSLRGAIKVDLSINEDSLIAELTLPKRRGPRSGWILDLDHLDRSSGSARDRNIHDTLMPVMVETAKDLSWGWVAWQRSEDDFLVTAVDGPSAGWFIRYSYGGHRMEGFQVLARADDVIVPDGNHLPSPDQIRIKLAFAQSRESALKKAHQLLEIQSATPKALTVVQGVDIELEAPCDLIWEKPNGEVSKQVNLDKLSSPSPGVHTLRRTAQNGRSHESRVLVLAPWEKLRTNALNAHREHYQLPVGAFARCLNAKKVPEGRTLAGVHFGNPNEGMSCRTGEFGGFGAWAQLLAMQNGQGHPEMESSVRAYFEWMCNKDREDNPLPGTLTLFPHSYEGRDYSPYHFHREINYAQHEAWFIEQLADAVDFGWNDLLVHLRGLCSHYLSDHVGENGVIWNQNWAREDPVDYSTVDCPMTHLLRAGEVLKEKDPELSEQLISFCRKQADHLLARGFDFPTEGEPCTEDGSIACQAWGLARAYNQLPNPNAKWLKLSRELMNFHAKLELSAQDVRLDGSSLRFWETMYETDEWGPSINGGHAWTLWSAFARMELFRASGDFEDLWQLWRHTQCVLSRQGEDGLFHPCYTPDPVPSLPHDDTWFDQEKRFEGRMTTAQAGRRYPEGFSLSGMFLWILFPKIWVNTCGYDANTGRLINARLENGEVIPFCTDSNAVIVRP